MSETAEKKEHSGVMEKVFIYNEELNRDELFRQEGRKEGRKEGLEEGRKEGREEGVDIMVTLYQRLKSIGRVKDYLRGLDDQNYRKQLLTEFGFFNSPQEAATI